ncbi:MAG: hypothetical protein GXO63_01490 [Candidatus Micrarchaeota archaeon]|nr:hypothetical protein [Candidatus Micrarchaeota archaeon]
MLHKSFKKLAPRRPAVVRKKDVVEVCYLYQRTRECLGPMCLWPRIGKCKIFSRKFGAK